LACGVAETHRVKMKPRMKHLRHPLRAAAAARNLLALYLNIKSFGDRSHRSYRGDARYDLMNVSNGFASRLEDSCGDDEVLDRICSAYVKAAQGERFAAEEYQASAWWRQVRQESLGPVIRALGSRDIASLREMYRNFFRDASSAGLIGVPYGLTKAYFDKQIADIHRRYFLGDALYGIDHWKTLTADRFPLEALWGPEIGNPFGIMIGETLVRTGAAYQHYSAYKIANSLTSDKAKVAEFGGGFGGMAYYLLRDHPGLKYIDFDLPESLALTSYYLLRSFPHQKFLLYGERAITPETLASADIALLPLFEMESLPNDSVEMVFSSHAMSDLSPQAMSVYLRTISRISTGCLLYMGNGQGAESIRNTPAGGPRAFRLDEMNPSGWNTHRFPKADEVECLFAPAAANEAVTACNRQGPGR
jgi:hypothetical protein